MSDRLVESDEGWKIVLSDARVGCIHVDFRLGLDLDDTSGSARLTVETPCQLLDSEGEITIVPSDAATTVPVLVLFNVGVDEVAIARDGELTVQFSNGHRLEVHPSDEYEAWQITCEREFLIVCQPGGDVSIFKE